MAGQGQSPSRSKNEEVLEDTKFLVPDEIRPMITYQDTNMRCAISPEQCLLITIRFLATGLSYSALHLEFLLGKSTISIIVRKTCHAIWEKLQPLVMAEPSVEDWYRIANGFYEKTQFPNCIGAIDGKHIRVKKPPNSGTQYFNYKQYFSVVLLAIADTNYNFVAVDIGAYGRTGDSRIFNNSVMGQRLRSNDLSVPPPRLLPGTSDTQAPFVIVGDEAFQLHREVLRPYPRRVLDNRRRIFNYRLTRARRVVECAFGILTAKWRVLITPLQLSENNVNTIIKACVVLHNFVQKYDNIEDNITSSMETNETHGSQVMARNIRAPSAIRVREIFTNYFVSPEGEIDLPQHVLMEHVNMT
ncbi:uncharacterized protein ACNLHF_009157 [Anomaloglossus baeobatrachus]